MIDYNEFLEQRFDIVVRYHYLKKFEFNYQEIIEWSNNQEWLKEISSKGLFHDWSKIERKISEDWLKKHYYGVVDDYGLGVKRFILSLNKELHLYWTKIKTDNYQKSNSTERANKWNILSIKKLLTEKEFEEINNTKYKMIEKMKELEYFSEDYMITPKKQIDEILMSMDKNIHSGNKNIRFSKLNFYYHSVPEINIKGYRNCLERIQAWGIYPIIKNKRVLDIGSNMGMMSIECAKQAKLVHGIETSIGYIEISNIIKKYFNLSNVNFINESFIDYNKSSKNKYDVILVLAVSNWVGMSIFDFFIECKNILLNNGTIIFETHRVKKPKIIEIKKEINNAGFKVEEIGNYGNRHTFKCKMKDLE